MNFFKGPTFRILILPFVGAVCLQLGVRFFGLISGSPVSPQANGKLGFTFWIVGTVISAGVYFLHKLYKDDKP